MHYDKQRPSRRQRLLLAAIAGAVAAAARALTQQLLDYLTAAS
jgi:hypothetical protein